MIDNNIKNKINKYIDYLLENSKPQAPMWNIEKVLSGEPNKWNYIDGCMITAILSLYEMTGNEKYYEFAKNFVKANDGMFADVMYKRIKFDIPLHGSSAVVQYVRRYGEFVPEQVFIWYFVSVDEFTGFFMDDFQAGKGYMVVEDE